MQQCLPFTVLKRLEFRFFPVQKEAVATVLTVYGIETPFALIALAIEPAIKVATVLTVYGIETRISLCREYIWIICVATVLTVYGIETQNHS